MPKVNFNRRPHKARKIAKLNDYFRKVNLLCGIFILLISACKPEPFAFNTHIEAKCSLKHSNEPFAGEWVVLLLDGKEIQRTKTSSDGRFKFKPFAAGSEQMLTMYLLNKDFVNNKTTTSLQNSYPYIQINPYYTADNIGYNVIFPGYNFNQTLDGSLLEQGFTFLPQATAGIKNIMEIELTRTTEVRLHFKYPQGSNPLFLSYFGFDYINTVPYPTITSFSTFQIPLGGRTFTIKHLPEKSEVSIPYFYRSQSFQTVYETLNITTGSKESPIDQDIIIQ